MSLLEKAKNQSDSAELLTVNSESLSVSFTAGEIKSSERKDTFGTALRVIKDGRIGFSSAIGIENEDLLLKNAIESAQFGDKVDFSFASPAEPAEVETYHESIRNLSIEKMIEMGRAVADKLKKAEEGLQIDVGLGRVVSNSALQTTNGLELKETESSFGIGAGIERIDGNDILMLYHSGQSVKVEDFTDEVTTKILERLEISRNLVAFEGGPMPVIFPPRAMMTLLLPLLQAINGKTLAQGSSPLEGKLEEKLFDEKFTLYDNPLVPLKPASSSFDGEGIPCRKMAIVEKGVLKNYVLDLKTASQTNMKSTGSARRGLTSTPSPGTSNLVMEPGNTSINDIISDIEKGLWVDTVLGLGMGNLLSGSFSNTLGVAFKIENGKLTGRVKNVSIAGNIYELLKNITAISKETEWLGSLCMPYLMLESLPVVVK